MSRLSDTLQVSETDAQPDNLVEWLHERAAEAKALEIHLANYGASPEDHGLARAMVDSANAGERLAEQLREVLGDDAHANAVPSKALADLLAAYDDSTKP